MLDTRQGRSGATGPGTTVYSIKQTGVDPNAGILGICCSFFVVANVISLDR